VETLQEGLKSALCDCWPEPGDDFDRILSRTRACDKDLWGPPVACEDGPLASSQATHGELARLSQKENLGPFSSIPSVVAVLPVKLKAPAPPRGPRGPGLLRAARDQEPAVAPGSKPKISGARMPPRPAPGAVERKQSDRIPKAPVPPRLAPRVAMRQLDKRTDALTALQAAEK
jgi:hypothetical protein